MLTKAIAPLLSLITNQTARALSATSLVTSVVELEKHFDTLTFDELIFNDDAVTTAKKTAVQTNRNNALSETLIDDEKISHLSTPEDIAPIKEKTANPTFVAPTTLMKVFEDRNTIELEKLDEIKELVITQQAMTQTLVAISQQLDVIGMYIKQSSNIMAITMPEIATSNTKQAEGIRKQSEYTATLKASQVSVNIPATEVVNNIDFTELSTPMASIVTKLNNLALNADEQKKLAQAKLSEQVVTYTDGTPVLDAQGLPISKTAIQLETMYRHAVAREKEKAEAIHDFRTTEQVIANLDGRPLTKDDGTAVTVSPLQAQLIKDVALAKNQADEAEFELDNNEIDTLIGLDFTLPEYQTSSLSTLDENITTAINTLKSTGGI